MTYCALLDLSWELRLGLSQGPFFFSLVFISLEAKWGSGRSYFILADQAVCFGATYHLRPSGAVLRPFNYSMLQTRSLESDKLTAILGCWVLLTSGVQLPAEASPSGGGTSPPPTGNPERTR